MSASPRGSERANICSGNLYIYTNFVRLGRISCSHCQKRPSNSQQPSNDFSFPRHFDVPLLDTVNIFFKKYCCVNLTPLLLLWQCGARIYFRIKSPLSCSLPLINQVLLQSVLVMWFNLSCFKRSKIPSRKQCPFIAVHIYSTAIKTLWANEIIKFCIGSLNTAHGNNLGQTRR